MFLANDMAVFLQDFLESIPIISVKNATG